MCSDVQVSRPTICAGSLSKGSVESLSAVFMMPGRGTWPQITASAPPFVEQHNERSMHVDPTRV